MRAAMTVQYRATEGNSNSNMWTSEHALRPIREFGALMERNGQVAVDVGGVLVPGPDFSTPFGAGKEGYCSDRTRQKEGEGKGAEAQTTSSTAAHAFGLVSDLRVQWTGNDISKAELEGLEAVYPDIAVVASSSRLVYLALSIQPFPSLPYSARLLLEIPRPQNASATRLPRNGHFSDLIAERGLPWRPQESMSGQCLILVPAVRAWARWVGGPTHGMSVLSHHRQPDLSICACMPYQWVRGVNPLVDYIGMCVTWFARLLHERALGVYPGRQHYPEWSRIERDRPGEFCGCGAGKRYAECHRRSDNTLSASVLRGARDEVHRLYFMELLRQGRPSAPPIEAWR